MYPRARPTRPPAMRALPPPHPRARWVHAAHTLGTPQTKRSPPSTRPGARYGYRVSSQPRADRPTPSPSVRSSWGGSQVFRFSGLQDLLYHTVNVPHGKCTTRYMYRPVYVPYVQIYIHTCIGTYIRTCIRTYVHMYIRTYTPTYHYHRLPFNVSTTVHIHTQYIYFSPLSHPPPSPSAPSRLRRRCVTSVSECPTCMGSSRQTTHATPVCVSSDGVPPRPPPELRQYQSPVTSPPFSSRPFSSPNPSCARGSAT